MEAIQLKDYGSKIWLVQLGPPRESGRRDVARSNGRTGRILTFESREAAEEFIKQNPKHGTTEAETYEWRQLSLKDLEAVIEECDDVGLLKLALKHDTRKRAKTLATARIKELEG